VTNSNKIPLVDKVPSVAVKVLRDLRDFRISSDSREVEVALAIFLKNSKKCLAKMARADKKEERSKLRETT